VSERDPKKFDPARAGMLDAPERERHLPTATVIGLLELSGGETLVDYGAGTGRFALAAATALPHGRVLAVDESEDMAALLSERLRGTANAQALLISDNSVPLGDGEADRVLAVNVMHEIRGERAFDEMRRVLGPGGLLVMVDWERGRERPVGPPDELLYTAAEAQAELDAVGFAASVRETDLPYHFVLQALAAGF
jgi:ubiquinone/menaquinone biosynthesis C-methylase UbiE